MAASYLNVEAVLPVACENARAQASLALDCELSQHERAQLCSHLAACGDCAAFVGGLRNLTHELRTAPLPAPSRPLLPRRTRRARGPVLLALLTVVAAAAAGTLAGAFGADATHVSAHAVSHPHALPDAPTSPSVPA
jgi:anti-sigma factor RsiW